MSDYFPEHLIEQVKQASDIVEVLSDFLKLKKRGTNWWCNCPFHNEKTPSFAVSEAKQIYHCFGCGKGGNVLTFLMEYEKLSFPEAVRFLAQRSGIQLPERKLSPAERSRYEGLFFANQTARKFFVKQLWETGDGHKVLHYLKQVRRLSEEIINKFQLGFAPNSWDALLKHARSLDLSEDDLVKAGLAVKREDSRGAYDRFRRRLMVPIMNLTGKTIAFGGRALSKEDRAKYLNSPETELYNKSKVLYGLNFSRAPIRDTETCILVEGYMDYLALYQAGIENVVASSGTAFTFDHARLIARYARQAVMLFDSDQAGMTAAKRCAPHLMAAELDFRVVLLPKGQDPDSFIKAEGAEKMKVLIDNALSYPRFIYDSIQPGYDSLSPHQKSVILQELTRLASKSDSSIRRELFLKEIAEVFDIELNTLKSDLRKTPHKTRPQEADETRKRENFSDQLQLELISVFLENPDLLQMARDDLDPELISDDTLREIYEMILQTYEDSGGVDTAGLINQTDDPKKQHLITKAASLETGGGGSERHLADLIERLRRFNFHERLAWLKAKITEAQKSGDDELEQKYYNQLQEMVREMPDNAD
ncbi:MAG: DNA primase [candidate division Zixibacteria bacterium]|nr:DNA primase [candidate division Zixibacteria bacterium]